MKSQIFGIIVTLIVFIVAMLKVDTTGEQVIVCLLFFISAGIHHQMNQFVRVSHIYNLEILKNSLKERAKLGDDTAIEEYKEYLEAKEAYQKTSTLMVVNDIFLAVLTILSLFFLVIADKYGY